MSENISDADTDMKTYLCLNEQGQVLIAVIPMRFS